MPQNHPMSSQCTINPRTLQLTLPPNPMPPNTAEYGREIAAEGTAESDDLTEYPQGTLAPDRSKQPGKGRTNPHWTYIRMGSDVSDEPSLEGSGIATGEEVNEGSDDGGSHGEPQPDSDLDFESTPSWSTG